MASGLPLQQGLQAGSSPDGSSPALAVRSGMIRARGALYLIDEYLPYPVRV